jgi:hypothetical protein
MTSAERLQRAARAMIAAADSGRSVVRVLAAECPHIARQLRRDRRRRGLLALWGRSRNVDENVGAVIVHPAILAVIGRLAGVSMRGPDAPAGLQHTYGYLFSLIDTPYGAKRERWLSTDLERGFGIDESLLSDNPRAGTLLANATWLAGQIAFRSEARQCRRLQAQAAAAAPELTAYDFALHGARRIVEEAMLPGPGRLVQMITDLVPFPSVRRAARDDTLLVYSARTGAAGPLRLVTMFPVGAQTVRALEDSLPARGRVAVRPRYNAYIRGWPDGEVMGRRFLVEV